MYASLIPIFGILYALADRFSGGGLGWERLKHDGGGFLRGRPLYYAFLGLLIPSVAANYLIPHGELFLYGLSAWVVWRSPGWHFLGGTLNPKTPRELFGTFLRHFVFIMPVYIWLMADTNIVWWAPVIAMTAWAAASAASAYFVSYNQEDGSDLNYAVELTRGTLYGSFLGLLYPYMS